MTIESLGQAYLIWLGGQVRKGNRYLDLFEVMDSKEFVWVVANDDNRIEDALDLRREFLMDTRFRNTFQFAELASPRSTAEFIGRPASVLEVLIGLSRRLSFAEGGIAEVWAWKLVENLELHLLRDPLSPRKRERVDERLDALIFRTYQPNGVGGFFPLGYPEQDQTKVEIWYQMSAYLAENEAP